MKNKIKTVSWQFIDKNISKVLDNSKNITYVITEKKKTTAVLISHKAAKRYLPKKVMNNLQVIKIEDEQKTKG